MRKGLPYALVDVKYKLNWHPHGECQLLNYVNVMDAFIDILWTQFGYTSYEAHVAWHDYDHTILDKFQVFEGYLSTCEQIGLDLEITVCDWQYMITCQGYTDDMV